MSRAEHNGSFGKHRPVEADDHPSAIMVRMSGEIDPPARSSQLERALVFMRAGVAATADAVREIEGGIVASTPSLPAVWAVNQLRVAGALTSDALIDLADEQLARFDYRHVAVEHQAAGPELEVAFRHAGWKVERDIIMVQATYPDRGADTSIVEDAGEEDVLELIRRWYEEDEPRPSEIDQLVAYGRREARTLGDRLLGVRSRDGELVAISKLRSDGHIAQVEDVYTVPEARGRGFARALVTRAVELARAAEHELVFIVADDADWPKLLYGRLGFQRVGHLWQFHRD
jgi:ribosomal protein S18 acetylase RimI-like enzyme